MQYFTFLKYSQVAGGIYSQDTFITYDCTRS